MKTNASIEFIGEMTLAQVDIFIVRDADSRLTSRDAAVVADWLKQKPETAAMFHCIRDHPAHSDSFINGGLWGARRRQLHTLFNGRYFQRRTTTMIITTIQSNFGKSEIVLVFFICQVAGAICNCMFLLKGR